MGLWLDTVAEPSMWQDRVALKLVAYTPTMLRAALKMVAYNYAYHNYSVFPRSNIFVDPDFCGVKFSQMAISMYEC